MKKTTRETLDTLGATLYVHSTRYKFDKHKLYSDKYRKGNLAVYDWLSELCFYYLKKEEALMKEFLEVLDTKQEELNNLPDGEFKAGVFNAIRDVRKLLKENPLIHIK